MTMLAAAMMVRNEEALLPGCLESLESVIPKERIVVVDTGSTDKTLSVASDFGVKLYHPGMSSTLRWQYDFGLHRNQSFDYASRIPGVTHIMSIDADERLKPESAEKIPYMLDFMDNNSLNFAIMQIENILQNGGMGLHTMPRIFRKGTVNFEGIIQEQAIIMGKGYHSNLWINHLGYALEPEVMDKKNKQREDLLRMALDKEQGSPLYTQSLIKILMAQRQWKECAMLADELLDGDTELSRTQEQNVKVDRLIIAMAMEDPLAYVTAIRLAEQFPENLDAQYYLGTLSMDKGDLDGAIEAIKTYLMIRYTIQTVGLHDHVLLNTWGWQSLAFNNLGVAYWQRGDLIDALSAMFLGKSANGQVKGLEENMRRIVGTLLFQKGEMARCFPELTGELGEEGVD